MNERRRGKERRINNRLGVRGVYCFGIFKSKAIFCRGMKFCGCEWKCGMNLY